MAFLRLADPNATTRITHESGDSWLDLRANLSKREINAVLAALPASMWERAGEQVRFSFEEGAGMAESLFVALVKGWSLDDSPSVETYLGLEGAPAAWVDSAMFEHFQSLQMSSADEKGPSTSPKGSRKDTGATD